jgi:hypothetical protein
MISHFKAYKNQEDGLVCFSDVQNLVVTDVVVVDNWYGISTQPSSYQVNQASILNSVIYGDTESPDSICKNKYGLLLPTMAFTSGKKHIVKRSELPWHKIKTEPSFFSTFSTNNITFDGFSSTQSKCGGDLYAIRNNEITPDMGPLYIMNNTNFVNVCDNCVAFLEGPDPSWANGDDCGDFPCSFPNNVFLKFQNATGKANLGSNFKAIHNQQPINSGF